LNRAQANPNSLTTWDGYISSTKKISESLKGQGIQCTILSGANYSPDLWYPYLWMLGGDIVVQKDGHPTKRTYWFPAYNSSAGVKALEFIKEQINAGIKPEKDNLDKNFVDHKVIVYIGGSWMPGWFQKINWQVFLKDWGLYQRFLYLLGLIRVVL
jgi:multiple sugar transport system substrate-binding protein